MRPVVIDFESYYADDFTLSKMSTEAYIRDPRFVAHGAAIKWSPDTSARWYDERQLRFVLKEEDWSDVFLISHHAQFDHLILSHHYDVHPKMSGCTLSMARLLLGNHIGVSLDSVREQFGLPVKKTPYHLFRGKHWNEIPREHQQLIGEGAEDEVESIWILFGKLMATFPRLELPVVDMTIKMFSEPCLQADMTLLGRIWKKENDDKQRRLDALGVDPKELSSSDKFAELLRVEGVEPEKKLSPTNSDKQIWAFAKTDSFMQDLLEDDNERIRTLAEARLGIKSTLLQTRAETLGWMGRRGPLCVYLRMYGAHTTRWSGGDGSNFQNLKKSDPDFSHDDGGLNIREAILAPEGYLLGAIDASQIECRLLNFIADQHDVIENFRNGRDPYVNVASEFYGFPVTKEKHPTERNVGKVLELQAGYGSGGDKIRATLRTKAGIILSPAEGLKARDAYRDTHPQVVDFWGQGGRMLARLAGGPELQWGPTTIADGKIWLPNGCPLQFGTIEYYRDNEADDSYWRVKTRRGWSKLYGAKLVENLIQALARVVMSDAMLRIMALGYRIVTTTHDELVVLIKKDGSEQKQLDACTVEMKRVPSWLPGIPLDAESVMSERYAK